MPSFEFLNNIGPLIMTRIDHTGGTHKIMLNPFRQPYHILPPEKIYPSIIKILTIKP